MSAQDVLLGFIGKLNDLKPSLEPDTPPEGEPTPEKWAYQVDQVKRFTTRFTLMSRDCPSYEDALPMATLLFDNVAKFVALYQLIYLCSCRALQQQLKDLMEELIHALIELAEQIAKENSEYETVLLTVGSKAQKDKTNFLADRRYGQVEQCLQRLAAAPLDDYRATATVLERSNKLIRDALKELEACLAAPDAPEEAPATEEDTTAPEEEGESDFWDLDDQDDLGLTKEQKEVLPPCIMLTKVSGGALLAISKALKTATPQKQVGMQHAQEGDVKQRRVSETFDRLCAQAERIQHAVDDLACGVYPPQDRTQLVEQAELLCGLVKDLIKQCEDEEVLEEIQSSVAKLSSVATSISGNALTQLRNLLSS